MKLVKIVWEDAGDMDTGPWVFRSDIKNTEPIHFHQVGWLVEHTEAAVVLTSCVGDELMGVRCRIPIGMVRSMVELTDGPPLPLKVKKVRQSKKGP